MLSKAGVKYIQSLQQKKFRELHQCFVAEGPKVVKELLAQRYFPVKEIFALPAWVENESALFKDDFKVEVVAPHELEKLSALPAPNQVVAVFGYRGQPFILPETGLVLALDNIRDPGNFGTILRIADWFGVQQILCSHGCVDVYNPKVVQSTMASLGRVAVHYVSLEEIFEKSPLKIYAAHLDGDALQQTPSFRDGILLIGNESAGISEALLQYAHKRITIPRIGNAESLNAAVATGILLYHCAVINEK